MMFLIRGGDIFSQIPASSAAGQLADLQSWLARSFGVDPGQEHEQFTPHLSLGQWRGREELEPTLKALVMLCLNLHLEHS